MFTGMHCYEKYSFYNLTMPWCSKPLPAMRMRSWTSCFYLPDGEATLLEDLTQCGVGVESDTEGNNYITILLTKADS